jgi:deoxycytidylate deaminase
MSVSAEYIPRAPKLHKYTSRLKRYFEVAKRAAIQSEFPDYRHGAILVKGNSIRNISSNKSNFCSFGNRFRSMIPGKATLHAELGAILGIDRSITEGATIFVMRVGKEGDYKMSMPCAMCHEAMRHVGIKKVIYSINNETAGSYKL